MNSKKIVLQVGGVNIFIYSNCLSDIRVIEKKYADYILHKEIKRHDLLLELRRGDINNVVKQSSREYLITLKPLLNNFGYFNDILRFIFYKELCYFGGLLFHGSALVINSQGFVFVGKKGAGKSTVRKILHDIKCLGDDTAIVRRVGKKYYLYGSPFYQRTQRTYPNTRVPLAGIFGLKKRSYDLVERLDYLSSVMILKDGLYMSNIQGDKRRDHECVFKRVADIAQELGCFGLHFRKRRTFLKLIVNASSSRYLQSGVSNVLSNIQTGLLPHLPEDIEWSRVMVFPSFFSSSRVVREYSWLFEFNRERRISKISRIVGRKEFDSSHKRKILRFVRKLPKSSGNQPIVVLTKNGKFTTIDGNHRAVALTVRKEEKNEPVRLLLGRLQSECKIF